MMTTAVENDTKVKKGRPKVYVTEEDKAEQLRKKKACKEKYYNSRKEDLNQQRKKLYIRSVENHDYKRNTKYAPKPNANLEIETQ